MQPRKRKTVKKRNPTPIVIILAVLLLSIAFQITPPGQTLLKRVPHLFHSFMRVFSQDGAYIPQADAYGLDISRFQGDIQWDTLPQIHFEPITRCQRRNGNIASAPVSFVFAKASEGATHVDPAIDQNRTLVRKLAIPFGAYHVLTLSEPKEQARNFISNAKLRKGDLTPVIDLEEDILGKYDDNDVIKTVVDVAQRLKKKYGPTPIIYGSHKYISKLSEKGLPDDYPLWIARYSTKDRPQNADIWQFTDCGTIPGVNHDIDINALFSDRHKLTDYVIRK